LKTGTQELLNKTGAEIQRIFWGTFQMRPTDFATHTLLMISFGLFNEDFSTD
jgi:hypothetical protein